MENRPYKTWIITPVIFCAVSFAPPLYYVVSLFLFLPVDISLSSMYANHCGPHAGHCRSRCVMIRSFPLWKTQGSLINFTAGFVLAGIPVFYITRQNEANEYRIFCERCIYVCVIRNKIWFYSAWLSRRIKHIRGYRHPDEGWEAVNTEGDEPIEMSEGRRHSWCLACWLAVLYQRTPIPGNKISERCRPLHCWSISPKVGFCCSPIVHSKNCHRIRNRMPVDFTNMVLRINQGCTSDELALQPQQPQGQSIHSISHILLFQLSMDREWSMMSEALCFYSNRKTAMESFCCSVEEY